MYAWHSTNTPHHVQDERDNVPSDDFDDTDVDFAEWSKGWHDTVFKDDTANPDITLGELLLVYFEWMSVHKVS